MHNTSQQEIQELANSQIARKTGDKLPVAMDGQQTQGAWSHGEGNRGSQQGSSQGWKKTICDTEDAREIAFFVKGIGANGSIPPTPESWKNPKPATAEEAKLA